MICGFDDSTTSESRQWQVYWERQDKYGRRWQDADCGLRLMMMMVVVVEGGNNGISGTKKEEQQELDEGDRPRDHL